MRMWRVEPGASGGVVEEKIKALKLSFGGVIPEISCPVKALTQNQAYKPAAAQRNSVLILQKKRELAKVYIS